MLEGWTQEDPPTLKKLPVEADIPEYIANIGYLQDATEAQKAIGDLVLIAFYYLLRVGEYTTKATRNNSKRTVQFKIEDITFFSTNKKGILRQLPRSASDADLMAAQSATLKLDNQKNGWKGVCIHQERNGDTITAR